MLISGFVQKKNKNKKLRSFKSKENTTERKMGHTAVSAIEASSVTL